jgi:hypothetical protein
VGEEIGLPEIVDTRKCRRQFQEWLLVLYDQLVWNLEADRDQGLDESVQYLVTDNDKLSGRRSA